MSEDYNLFPDYQTLEPGSKGAPAKANRSIPDRVEDYGLMEFIKPTTKVLDIGCNRGFFGTYLSEHIAQYVGVESDPNQLKHAQIEYNMRLIEGKFRGFDEQFHVILCLAVHAYVDISAEEFAVKLRDMCAYEGTLFIEGHPPGYLGEPEAKLNPFILEVRKYFTQICYKTVIDRTNKRPFYIFKKMDGMVSYCERDGHVIYKHYYDGKPDETTNQAHWDKETIALDRLPNNHFPKLIVVSRHLITMTWCGDRITKETVPKNWKEQCARIEDIMKHCNIWHGDIKPKNICVKNNTIYLIDWGIWSDNKSNYKSLKKVINGILST